MVDTYSLEGRARRELRRSWVPFGVACRAALFAGILLGCLLDHAKKCPAILRAHFGPSPTHVGLFHITTIQKCVRVPTHAPLYSAGFAGGFRVTAFHARFIALRVSRRHGACASPRHLGERNCTSTAPKLSKTLRSRPFIPDTSCHFEGTDRSFPIYTAFPCAEYYDGSDAVAGRWWTAHLGMPAAASHVHDDGRCEVV